MLDQYQRRVLAQVRPSSTSAVAGYVPSSNLKYGLISGICIANTTGSTANYSVYLHPTGSTADATTALAMGVALSANTSVWLSFPDNYLPINYPGQLSVQTSVGNALTFTINGLDR